MVSTLKLTKIQIPNSDSDVISLDASSGNITVPKPVTFSETLGGTSITVQGENTATTNLQQGLAKVWICFNQDTPAIRDSFNVGSVTDSGTGDYNVNFSNNMNNTDYCGVCTGQAELTNNDCTHYFTHSTNLARRLDFESGSLRDGANSNTLLAGDLA